LAILPSVNFKCGTHLGLEILETTSKVGQFRRSNQNHVEFNDHHTGEFEILTSALFHLVTHIILFQYFGDRPKDPFGIEVQAQLPDDQTPTGLEQTAIGTKQLQDIDHEAGKVGFLG
jgi:hypothetical protein